MGHRHVVRLVRHLVEQLLVADHGDQPRLADPAAPACGHRSRGRGPVAPRRGRPPAPEQERRRPRRRSSPAATARPVRAARTARSPTARADTRPTAAPRHRRRRWSARPAAAPGRHDRNSTSSSSMRSRLGADRDVGAHRAAVDHQPVDMSGERRGLLRADVVGNRTAGGQQPFSQCGLARGRHKVNDMVSTMATSPTFGSPHGDRARGRSGHPFPARDQDRAQGTAAGRRHPRHRVGRGRGGRSRRRAAGDHHLRGQRRRRRALRRRPGAGRHAGGARQEGHAGQGPSRTGS